MTSQRDAFIERLFEKAVDDKDIYLISVDMGAPSLDRWRAELPEQFFAAGISEQNAVNFAAGLAGAGKKVYIYFMAAWAARCFEQIRYSCALADKPITVLGNGVGLGYAPAGPAHYPTEDIAYMRSICGVQIISPANSEVARKYVDITCDKPSLTYMRMERTSASELADVKYSEEDLQNGFKLIQHQDGPANAPRVCIVSSGYMLGRAVTACNMIKDASVAVVDVFKSNPLDNAGLKDLLAKYEYIVTLEEQTLTAGFGSAICEMLADFNCHRPILRKGLPNRFIFENASRDYLLDNNGLSVDNIVNDIRKFIK